MRTCRLGTTTIHSAEPNRGEVASQVSQVSQHRRALSGRLYQVGEEVLDVRVHEPGTVCNLHARTRTHMVEHVYPCRELTWAYDVQTQVRFLVVRLPLSKALT